MPEILALHTKGEIMKTSIYVFAGGKSTEHEVSLISAQAMINSLDREKYDVYVIYITKGGAWVSLGLIEENIKEPSHIIRESCDSPHISIAKFLSEFPKENAICLLSLHGTYGEDGRIQGLFEMANIPYTGDNTLASALNMDKVSMKALLKSEDLPQTKYSYFSSFDYERDPKKIISQIEKNLSYPLFVKPSNGGSSVGISRAKDRESLIISIDLAKEYDDVIICEEELVGREIQISVLGNHEAKASIPGEFIMERPFFDYEAKYLDKKIIPIAPAKMSNETMEKMRECAIKAYRACRCNGLARVDFFIKEDETFYICELNTMPGFTPLSFTPKLWEKTDGTSYQRVVERLIELGFESFNDNQRLKRQR